MRDNAKTGKRSGTNLQTQTKIQEGDNIKGGRMANLERSEEPHFFLIHQKNGIILSFWDILKAYPQNRDLSDLV